MIVLNVVKLNPFVENKGEAISDSSIGNIEKFLSLFYYKNLSTCLYSSWVFDEERFFICVILLVLPTCFGETSPFSHTILFLSYFILLLRIAIQTASCVWPVRRRYFAVGVHSNELFKQDFDFLTYCLHKWSYSHFVGKSTLLTIKCDINAMSTFWVLGMHAPLIFQCAHHRLLLFIFLKKAFGFWFVLNAKLSSPFCCYSYFSDPKSFYNLPLNDGRP